MVKKPKIEVGQVWITVRTHWRKFHLTDGLGIGDKLLITKVGSDWREWNTSIISFSSWGKDHLVGADWLYMLCELVE